MAMKKTTTKTETTAPHADHAGGSVTTTDHDAIKAWAEARGGKPSAVASTVSDDDVGLIRLEFPSATNANDSNLTEITWDEFFEKFDEGGLALVYQEQTAAGDTSSFNRLIKRETAAAATPKTAAKKATKQTAAKPAAKKASPVAKQTAKKTTAVKQATPAKPAAKKAPPAAKKAPPAAKKAAAKKVPAKPAAAKKKVTAKKVPAARGYRGR